MSNNNYPPKEMFISEYQQNYISQEYHEELLAKEVAKYRLQIVAIQDKLIAKQDELIKVLKSKSKK